MLVFALVSRSDLMIKDVIVNLEHRFDRDPARDFAISAAASFDAHLVAVAFAYLPDLAGYAMVDIPPEIAARAAAESERTAREVISRFDAARRRSNLSAEARLVKAGLAEAPDTLSHLARRFDLSVLMQSEPDGSDNDDMIESALFDSGRPIIVVPYIQENGLSLDRVVCCWDGSRAATRAINDALPVLAKAKTVDLLIVQNEKTATDRNSVRGVEMAEHLAHHDVKVTVETTPSPDIDVASAILSYVADNAATLIVMGGYGHARLRELILGGVTRDMLKSMTVPVFMSH
jgi:nucleotide-binding universal stress UspA family protein